MSWICITIRYEEKMKDFFKKGEWPFFPNATFPGPFSFQYVLLNSSAFNCSLARLRVVPIYFSGIVERAKRERAWKSPNRVSPFPRGVIFTRADVSLALPSLRKNEDYLWSRAGLNVLVFCSFFSLFWFVLFCRFIQCVLVRLPWLQLVCANL